MSKQIKGWVDAGHGGNDSGAVGPGGLRESDVVVSVANMVVNHLERAGIDMGSTRWDDKEVSLGGRTRAANTFDADFFVSIHCNSASSDADGIETFSMRGSDDGAKLAGFVQDSLLDEFLEAKDRGVKTAGFYVLRKTKMVAILVELEFIHHSRGEAHLSDLAVQERKALAIANGVLKYLGMAEIKKAVTEKDKSVSVTLETSGAGKLHERNEWLSSENARLLEENSLLRNDLNVVCSLADKWRGNLAKLTARGGTMAEGFEAAHRGEEV